MVSKGGNSPTLRPTKPASSKLERPHGQAAIDKLNEEVTKKTQDAIAALKPGEELAVTYRACSRPMQFLGLQSGTPVYVKRDPLPTYALILCGFCMIFGGAYALGPLALTPFLLSMVVMYVLYDFQSGVLHVMLDEPANIDVPYLGQPALEFQFHHHIPTDLVRKDFMDVLGDLNVVTVLLMLWHCVWSAELFTEPIVLMMAGMKLFYAYFGQYSHRSAHDPRIGQNYVAKTLQNLGLMISVKDHKAHHQPPHQDDFCLIGICNPLLSFMFHRVCHGSNRFPWIAFFLFTLLGDCVLVAPFIKAVSGVPADFRTPVLCEGMNFGGYLNCSV